MIGTDLDSARALLPAWVTWAPAIIGLASAALTFALTLGAALLALRPLARAPDAHWSQQARVAADARRTTLWVGATLTVVSAAFTLLFPAGGPLSLPPLPLWRPANLVLQCAVVAAAALAVEARLLPGRGLTARLKSLATWFVLLFPHFAFAILFAFVTGTLERTPAIILFIGVALVLALASGGGLVTATALRLARRPSVRLRRALDLALDGRESPGAFELPILSCNAFALPSLGAVGVTTEALRVLDDEELAAVLRHELAHLAEGGNTRLLRIANSAAVPLALVLGPGLFQRSPVLAGVVSVALVALWARTARLIQLPLEERADEEAAHGHPAVYAGALEKIHRHNLAPASLAVQTGHPDLYDRLLAAGVTPGWPRPAPPPDGHRTLASLLTILLAVVVGTSATRGRLLPEGAEDRASLLRAVALRQAPSDLASLGLWHFKQEQFEEAATLFAAAEALAPGEAGFPATVALSLSMEHHCVEAREALHRADLVVAGAPPSRYVESVRESVSRCTASPAARDPAPREDGP